MKKSNYVFTINNYTKPMLKQFEQVAQSLEKHRYICYSLEVGEKKKTKHIQGYIELNESQRFTFLQNYFNLQKKKKLFKFHIESAKGSQRQNLKYISKDSEAIEYGEPKKKGSRTDIINLKQRMKSNPQNLKNIIDEDVTNGQQLRFVENIQKYFFDSRDINKPPTVFWIYGSTGAGKTKLIYDSFESIHSVSDYKWPGNNYIQQECFLMDDFRPEDIPFHTLLKMIDRYPFTLAVKGSFIELNSPYIVITTTRSIELTYAGHREDINQLKRRLEEINLDLNPVEDLKKYQRPEDF